MNPLCSCKTKRKCELVMVSRNVGFAPRFLEDGSPCKEFAHWVFPQVVEGVEKGESPADGRWGLPLYLITSEGQLILALAKQLGYDVERIQERSHGKSRGPKQWEPPKSKPIMPKDGDQMPLGLEEVR